MPTAIELIVKVKSFGDNLRLDYVFSTMFSLLDLDQAIRSKMVNLGGGIWQCAECDLKTKSSNLYNHVESKLIVHNSSKAHDANMNVVCGVPNF